MTILVCGSGRSGTASTVAAFQLAGLDAHHERSSHHLLPLQRGYTAGVIDSTGVAVMAAYRLSHNWDVDGHYAWTPLIPAVLEQFDDVQVVWTVRPPTLTVASMVRAGWYRPSDDGLWPVMSTWYGQNDDGQLAQHYDLNHPAFRVTGMDTGDVSWSGWRDWSQTKRCGWWWTWTTELMLEMVERWPDRVTVWPIGLRPLGDLVEQVTGVRLGGDVQRNIGPSGHVAGLDDAEPIWADVWTRLANTVT